MATEASDIASLVDLQLSFDVHSDVGDVIEYLNDGVDYDDELNNEQLIHRKLTAHDGRVDDAVSTEEAFTLMDPVVVPNPNDLTDPSLQLHSIPLSEVRSQKHATRRGYLKKEILDRYYVGNTTLENSYFCDGTS